MAINSMTRATLKSGSSAVLAMLLAAGLAACTPQADDAAAVAEAPAAEPAGPAPAPDYGALLAAPGRSADDAKLDEARKPVEMLQFIGVQPGMTIYDMESGGGYMSDVLVRAVGPTGKVYMQNPVSFDSFVKDALDKRIAGGLTNAEIIKTQFDDLKAPDSSVDVVTWVMGPHELFYKPEGAPDGLGDVGKTYAEVFRILKPGGVFAIVDHAAPAGAPATSGNDTHRIDPALVRAEAEKAGFTLDGTSDIFANTADPKDKGVFDPSIQGKTDRFFFKYRKPAA
jgi:predicted methyltransferase